MHYSKNISWCVTEMLKYVPFMKQNVMKFEVFILGGQRIDQKRKNAWWRGRRERIEKASRERIEICASACCSASSRHCVSPES